WHARRHVFLGGCLRPEECVLRSKPSVLKVRRCHGELLICPVPGQTASLRRSHGGAVEGTTVGRSRSAWHSCWQRPVACFRLEADGCATRTPRSHHRRYRCAVPQKAGEHSSSLSSRLGLATELTEGCGRSAGA